MFLFFLRTFLFYEKKTGNSSVGSLRKGIEKTVVVSVSGGKDSSLTLALALERYRASCIPVIAVFCDTGWEHPLTYSYLDELERALRIRIIRIGRKGGNESSFREKRDISLF